MNLNDILHQCLVLPGVSHTQSAESTELHLDTADGVGTMRFFSLWPGFTLAFIRVQASRWPAPQLSTAADTEIWPLLVNFCLAGRCEMMLDDRRFVYVASGDVALSTRHAIDNYDYPLRQYDGIEFFIDGDLLTAACPWLSADFGLDISALVAQAATASNTRIAVMNDTVAHNLSMLWRCSDSPSLPALRLKSLTLFTALLDMPQTTVAPHPYFTVSQVAIAKETETIVTADLRVSHSAHTLAAHFGISETSLKNYFRGVYGQSLADYVRERRMTQAARLLVNSSHTVARIAEEVGYLNQSKFAAAFKRHYGVSPLEYRRRVHLR